MKFSEAKKLLDKSVYLKNWSEKIALTKFVTDKHYKSKAGVYLIEDQLKTVLYIGKARSLTGRLKCHLKATTGSERAPAWQEFFTSHDPKNLFVRVYLIPNEPFPTAEKLRQCVERLAQLQTPTLFEYVYSGGYKKVGKTAFEKHRKAYHKMMKKNFIN